MLLVEERSVVNIQLLYLRDVSLLSLSMTKSESDFKMILISKSQVKNGAYYILPNSIEM